jgi:hypothetical protein
VRFPHKIRLQPGATLVALRYDDGVFKVPLREKGILLMRENGFDVTPDEPTKARFEEMRYLEGSIGRTGLLAIQPLLHMSHKDLWQLYVSGK